MHVHSIWITRFQMAIFAQGLDDTGTLLFIGSCTYPYRRRSFQGLGPERHKFETNPTLERRH